VVYVFLCLGNVVLFLLYQNFLFLEKFNHVTGSLTKPFKARTRFYILVLVLFCLASIWSNILCFNFAIICIKSPVKESSTPISNDVSKKAKDDSDGVFSNDQNNYLTMAVAIGALIANFPVVLAVSGPHRHSASRQKCSSSILFGKKTIIRLRGSLFA
jgi:hypothetical protein